MTRCFILVCTKVLNKEKPFMMNQNGLENGNNNEFIKFVNKQLNEFEF
jgi:hypothetical protein